MSKNAEIKFRKKLLSLSHFSLITGLTPLLLLSCGNEIIPTQQDQQDQQIQPKKATTNQPQKPKDTKTKASKQPTQEQINSYTNLILLASESEVKVEFFKQKLDLVEKKILVLSDLERELDLFLKSLSELKEMAERYEDSLRLVAALQRGVARERYAKSNPSSELLLYTFGFKWLWGIFYGYAPSHSLATIEQRLKDVEDEVGSQLLLLRQETERLFKISLQNIKRFQNQLTKVIKNPKPILFEYLTTLNVLGHRLEAISQQFRREFTTRFNLAEIFPELLTSKQGQELVFNPEQPLTNQLPKGLPSKAEWIIREGGEWIKSYPSLITVIDNTFNRLNYAFVEPKRGTNIIAGLLLDAEKLRKDYEIALEAARDESKVALKRLAETKRNFPDIAKKIESSFRINEVVSRLEAVLETEKEERDKLLAKTESLTKFRELFNRLLAAKLTNQEARASLVEDTRLLLASLFITAFTLAERERVREERVDYLREFFLYTFGFKWIWGAFTGYQPTLNLEDKEHYIALALENLKATETTFDVFKTQQKVRNDQLAKSAKGLTNILEKANPLAKKLGFAKEFQKLKENLLNDLSNNQKEVERVANLSLEYATLISTYLKNFDPNFDSPILKLLLNEGKKNDMEESANTNKTKPQKLALINLNKTSEISFFNAGIVEVGTLGFFGVIERLIDFEATKLTNLETSIKEGERRLEKIRGYLGESLDAVTSLNKVEREIKVIKEKNDPKKQQRSQNKVDLVSGIFEFKTLFELSKFSSTIKNGLLVEMYSLSTCPYCKAMREVLKRLVKEEKVAVAIIDLDQVEGEFETALNLFSFSGTPYLRIYRDGAFIKEVLGLQDYETTKTLLGLE